MDKYDVDVLAFYMFAIGIVVGMLPMRLLIYIMG